MNCWKRKINTAADSFTAGIGAEAVQSMLQKLDLPELKAQLRGELAETTSEAKLKKIVKRFEND